MSKLCHIVDFSALSSFFLINVCKMKSFNVINQLVSAVYWILYRKFAALLRFEVDVVVVCCPQIVQHIMCVLS